jgi:hypothetical protein
MAVGNDVDDDGGAGNDGCRSRMSMVCGDRFGDEMRVEDGHEGGGRWR